MPLVGRGSLPREGPPAAEGLNCPCELAQGCGFESWCTLDRDYVHTREAKGAPWDSSASPCLSRLCSPSPSLRTKV